MKDKDLLKAEKAYGDAVSREKIIERLEGYTGTLTSVEWHKVSYSDMERLENLLDHVEILRSELEELRRDSD